MYEKFYGLTERPFSLLPDPDYLYLSPKHLRALTLLEYGMMNQAGFSVICGDTGAGKTTLIRRLLTELGEDTTVGLITNTHKSFGELLSWVLMAFGLDPENRNKAQMHQQLIGYLIEQYAQNRRTVLIVDEAQNMTADTLEELRMLSNINADKDQVLQVILAGQPALRETLRKPELMQFAQRIAVDYYLESLNRDETCEYIQHRLEVAGGDINTFTEAACHAIYRYSGGTPRLINLLCDTALVYGFAEQNRIIDAPLIEDVVREQHRNSILPTFNKPLDNEPRREAEPAGHGAEPARVAAQAVEKPVSRIIREETVTEPVQVTAQVQNAATGFGQASGDSVAVMQNAADELPGKSVRSKKTASKKPAPVRPSEAVQADPAENSSPEADQPLPGDTHVTPGSNQKAVAESIFFEEKPDASKESYPIVHIADEPRRNINVLILGFAGGMVLASLFMFAAAWMMFRNDTPASVPAAVVSPPPVSSAIPAADQTMQRERDEALAAAEALKRERDAALAAAQKQEAMRAAEKRASEIIAEQERKYTQEMELVRQRALDAEIAATKARERERIANEAAERARQEASRNAAATVMPAVAPPPPVVTTVPQAVETEPKPAAVNTRSKVETETQFSANPCNSPSAKFLSTCKK
ncbi:MAG: ral secretion pathway protein [Pseudomonadota bacterium]|nr:ral secretion pathway protein [Pseudomonadota bacterium]